LIGPFFPIISLIDKPIQELSNSEIKQLITILNLGEMTKETFIQLLREKLVNPGSVYNEARQEIENRNSIIGSTTERQEIKNRNSIIGSTTERQEIGNRNS